MVLLSFQSSIRINELIDQGCDCDSGNNFGEGIDEGVRDPKGHWGRRIVLCTQLYNDI